MSDFDPLGSLIETARPAMDASEGDCARLQSNMVRRVGLAALGAAIPTAATTGGALAAPAATGGIAKFLVILSLVGAAGGGIVYAVRAPKPAVPALSAPQAIGVLPTQSVAQETPAPVPEVAPATVPTPVASAEKRVAAPSIARPQASGNTLADEYALISRAQGALKMHDASLALSLVNEHASRFPKGQLGEERDALKVLSICSLGRPDARSSAERFLKNHPSSPFALRIRTACDSK